MPRHSTYTGMLMFQAQGPRDHMEDAAWVGTAFGAQRLVVADGMGGHGDGDLASAAVVELCRNDVSLDEIQTDALRCVVAAAGRRAGTTLSVVEARDGVLHWLHVGDSALWLVQRHERRATIRRLTANQSLFGQLRAAGQPGFKRQQHMLMSCLCGDAHEPPTWDSGSTPIPPGRVWVFGTTDGFHEAVSDEIDDDGLTGGEPDPERLLAALREVAFGDERGQVVTDQHAEVTHDNATVVGLRLDPR